MTNPVTIDLIADIVCPWCYIGKKQLDRALADFGPVDVHWRPFQLDPAVPPQGIDRKAYMAAKFGTGDKAKSVYQTILDAGTEFGIDFQFDRIETMPNTIDAHRLILWARGAGVQPQIVEALYRGYFIEGEDISSPRVLSAIAAGCGMNPQIVTDLLAGDADIERVRKEDEVARDMGIRGVPCFIIQGKFMLLGAQNPENIADALTKASTVQL